MNISVVIPVYNVEKYLEKCVNSVLRQQNIKAEIILIDDGSTDDSGTICDMLANKYENISVIHKENGGLSSARNVGLDNAKEKYVYFLDSDDEIEDGLFEFLKEIDKKHQFDVLGFNARVIYSNHEEILSHNIPNVKKGILLDGIEVLKETIPLSMVQLYIYRTEFLKKNKLRFWEGIYYEDMDFTPKVFLKNPKVLYDTGIFYRYNKRDGSITSSVSLKKYSDICRVCEFYLEYMSKCNEDSKKALQKLLTTYLLVSEEIFQQLKEEDFIEAKNIKTKLVYIVVKERKQIGFKNYLVGKYMTMFYMIRNCRRKCFKLK